MPPLGRREFGGKDNGPQPLPRRFPWRTTRSPLVPPVNIHDRDSEAGILIFVALAGTAVVLTRDAVAQAIVVSFYGLLLGIMFFVFQAPDVALSQITVGAVALPLMILLALARVKKHENDQTD